MLRHTSPLVGGDEIALRRPYPYTMSTPLKTNNDLYVEFPLNEGYFPAPMVGYSKVTIKSLATEVSLTNAKKPEEDPPQPFLDKDNIHSSGGDRA